MAEFLEILSVMVLVVLGAFALAAALALRSLTRANRVAPERRTAAPLSWLISPRFPARLHRRLRRAVVATGFSVGTIAPDALALRDVARELVARAVTLDDGLVAAHGLHPQLRHPRLCELAVEVRDVEGSAARLHYLSADWRRHMDQSTAAMAVPPSSLHERLNAVEAALRELPGAYAASAEPYGASEPITHGSPAPKHRR